MHKHIYGLKICVYTMSIIKIFLEDLIRKYNASLNHNNKKFGKIYLCTVA